MRITRELIQDCKAIMGHHAEQILADAIEHDVVDGAVTLEINPAECIDCGYIINEAARRVQNKMIQINWKLVS